MESLKDGPGSRKGIVPDSFGVGQAKQPRRAAKKSYEGKVSMEPFPVETVLRQLAELKRKQDLILQVYLSVEASQSKKIKASILYSYMMNRLSCTLQRNLANSIIC